MRQTTDQDGEGHSIAAAARVLGVSENAVRQRIKRESVTAWKIDGQWRIWLPDQESSRSPDHQTDHQTGYQETTSTDHQTDQEPTTRAIRVTPAALAQLEAIRDQWLQPLVDQLKEQAEQLGRLLAEKEAAVKDAEHLRNEIAALRTAHDAAIRAVDAVDERSLEEAGSSGKKVNAPDSPARRRKWAFWRR